MQKILQDLRNVGGKIIQRWNWKAWKLFPKLHLLILVSTLTDLFYWRGTINKFRTRAVQQQQFSKLYPFGLKMKIVAVSWSQNLPLNEPNLCQQRLKLAIIQCNMLWDPIMEDYMTMLASLRAIYIYMTNDFGQEKVVKVEKRKECVNDYTDGMDWNTFVYLLYKIRNERIMKSDSCGGNLQQMMLFYCCLGLHQLHFLRSYFTKV